MDNVLYTWVKLHTQTTMAIKDSVPLSVVYELICTAPYTISKRP